MNKVPEYCCFCGSYLATDTTKKEAWKSWLLCLGCGVQVEVTYGDQMGGAPYCLVDWHEPN